MDRVAQEDVFLHDFPVLLQFVYELRIRCTYALASLRALEGWVLELEPQSELASAAWITLPMVLVPLLALVL